MACVIAGSALIVWAVAPLEAVGGSARRGRHDLRDEAHGPYRAPSDLLGMTISAFGQMLLTAADMRGLFLLVGTVAYALFQGRAESRRWGNRIDGERSCP